MCVVFVTGLKLQDSAQLRVNLTCQETQLSNTGGVLAILSAADVCGRVLGNRRDPKREGLEVSS